MTSSRPSLGRGLLILRQKYGHGIRTAYYRDRVRPRILTTRPVECGSDRSCEIHVLTSAATGSTWFGRSKVSISTRNANIRCVFTMTAASDLTRLPPCSVHFPGARMITAHKQIGKSKKCLPVIRDACGFVAQSPLPKLFDFAHYLNARECCTR